MEDYHTVTFWHTHIRRQRSKINFICSNYPVSIYHKYKHHTFQYCILNVLKDLITVQQLTPKNQNEDLTEQLCTEEVYRRQEGWMIRGASLHSLMAFWTP